MESSFKPGKYPSREFSPFTLEHKDKDQFCRFEPTDDPESVFIRFKGACGHIMENVISREQAMAQVAFLYRRGYEEAEEPEGHEQKFLHDLPKA